jgi:transposase
VTAETIVAVAHSILIGAFHILKEEDPYGDLGPVYFTRRADPDRLAKHLVAQRKRLGHAVTPQMSTAQAAPQPERDFLTKGN